MGNIFRRSGTDSRGPTTRIVVPRHTISIQSPNAHSNKGYLNNVVKTTKYTVWSFIPKNLFEQFHRFANIYFLFIVLLNFVPQVNAVSPGIATIPVIGVLLVTAIKDAYEDNRRYRQDKRINHQPCKVYSRESSSYEEVEWRDVLVGDFIYLSCNEIIPADLILLNSSKEDGVCFVETSNLDGESNLKQRQVIKSFNEGEDFHPKLFTHAIECDAPNVEINRFNGNVCNTFGERIAINKDNVLLRGCAVRNTDYVEGIVVYAGHETKALINNRGPRHKRSKLEKQINRDIIWCVILLFIMCFLSGVGTGLFAERYSDIKRTVYFIPYIDEATDTVAYQGFVRFLTFIILYQVVIPIQLYVSIELIKLAQIYFIANDVELYYEPSDRPMECRALNIPEDLGQIEHVFSDKTGTLTENKMVLKKCTVFGTDYFESVEPDADEIPSPERIVNPDELYNQIRETKAKDEEIVCEPRLKEAVLSMTLESALQGGNVNSKIHEFFLHLAICNTVVVVNRREHQDPAPTNLSEGDGSTEEQNGGVYNRFASSNGSARRSSAPSVHSTQPVSSGSSNLEAESPDELAFVSAARAYGCKLEERSLNSVKVNMPGQGTASLRVLNILPFDSTRKRMSIVFQNPITDEVILFVKGADIAIFPHLRKVEDFEMKEMILKTRQHMEIYARQGYRTLCMAKKIISTNEYDSWRLKMKAAEMALENRDELMYDLACEMETDLTLLGATGIEDKLQDGVAETINSLKGAGINVWVLTGDNQETALNIAYSCHLISFEQDIIVLNAETSESAKELISSRLEEFAQREAYVNAGLVDSTQDVRNEFSNTSLGGHSIASSSASLVSFAGSNRNSVSSYYWRSNTALVIDGRTLAYLLDDDEGVSLLQLTQHCSSVLCVRATPFQKAALVKLVRNKLSKMTLAIGDGANDVSMIQTADVGVGISGQEGMQAIMASDYAIARFRYLKRLLFVHGHWCYERLARMTLYMWYKNTMFVFVLLWYQIYSGFSGNPLVDDFNLLGFNTVYTSLPPLIYGIVDQCVPEYVLMKNPALYKRGQKGKIYASHSYFLCILDALWQSLVSFFIPYAVYTNTDVGGWEMAQTVNTACVFTVSAHLAIETRYWHPVHLFLLLLSLLVFFIINFILCVFEPKDRLYFIIFKAMATPQYWFSVLLVVVVSLFPRYLWRTIQGTFFPTSCEKALQMAAGKIKKDSVVATWSSETSCASVTVRGINPIPDATF